MKRLNKFVVGLGLAAILAAGSSSVFAKADGARQRNISGQIVSIDRNARTMIVRDNATNREVIVQVPEGAHVKTSSLSGASISFELLLKGMVVRDLAVE